LDYDESEATMKAKRTQRLTLRRTLCGMLLVLCAFRPASAHPAAPSFTAKAMSGETFTKESVRGSVLLLQFWTTWCPHCREDQPALDNISSEFAVQGLVVLAVNVHEPEADVRQYLRERPRFCPIVLTQDTDLVAKYSPHSFPLYVVFDRDGNMAGTQNGAGGEEFLRQLLRRAGLKSGTADAVESRSGNSPPGQSVMPGKMIVLAPPRAPHLQTRTPQLATVFVLSSGERLETHDYMLTADSVRVTLGDQRRTITMSALDVKATLAANHERGIDLKFPASRHEIFLGP
jgi:cytochrome c biogenesis protein CcmG, thiol:disulfide interchange protein DsbE